ncbi:C1q-related factor-like [Haliotis rubra]|uniref:C1q-related factor-like n=1 Tax=Haliotis rubra TaxID=36100 RepID=UPI001EE5A8BE|nr:C1q-related factor-like [Haliotis rubra]
MPHGSSNGDVQLNLTLLDVMSRDVKLNTALFSTLQTDVHIIQNNLSFTSSEVAALKRNMSGVATKIPDVAFQAHDPPSHTPSSSPVLFQLVNYNAGSGYNSNTGKFTAPVSGTYIFWTQLEMGGGSNTALYVYIKRTGGMNMAAGYMETLSTFGDVDASAQTVDHLEKGQEVWVEITTTYEIYHSASYFGGALLSV